MSISNDESGEILRTFYNNGKINASNVFNAHFFPTYEGTKNLYSKLLHCLMNIFRSIFESFKAVAVEEIRRGNSLIIAGEIFKIMEPSLKSVEDTLGEDVKINKENMRRDLHSILNDYCVFHFSETSSGYTDIISKCLQKTIRMLSEQCENNREASLLEDLITDNIKSFDITSKSLELIIMHNAAYGFYSTATLFRLKNQVITSNISNYYSIKPTSSSSSGPYASKHHQQHYQQSFDQLSVFSIINKIYRNLIALIRRNFIHAVNLGTSSSSLSSSIINSHKHSQIVVKNDKMSHQYNTNLSTGNFDIFVLNIYNNSNDTFMSWLESSMMAVFNEISSNDSYFQKVEVDTHLMSFLEDKIKWLMSNQALSLIPKENLSVGWNMMSAIDKISLLSSCSIYVSKTLQSQMYYKEIYELPSSYIAKKTMPMIEDMQKGINSMKDVSESYISGCNKIDEKIITLVKATSEMNESLEMTATMMKGFSKRFGSFEKDILDRIDFKLSRLVAADASSSQRPPSYKSSNNADHQSHIPITYLQSGSPHTSQSTFTQQQHQQHSRRQRDNANNVHSSSTDNFNDQDSSSMSGSFTHYLSTSIKK